MPDLQPATETGRDAGRDADGEADRDTIRYERVEDGVVVLVLDDPAQSANTMNTAYVRSMGAVLDRLEAERDAVTGVIVTSAKPTFFAGGDLKEMVRVTRADAPALTAALDTIKAQLRRLERLGRPVVAAVNGSALGGGLEIALACHHRIVVDDPRIRIGFPEVTLGLLPGAGGVTRTVRMLGIVEALTKVLLEGRQFRPAQARELGLVDEVVDSPDRLLDRAREWISEHPAAVQPWDVKGYRIPGGSPSSPSLAAMLPAMPARLKKQIKGAPMPAPRAILAAAVEGAQVDVDTATVIETRYLVDLLCGQVAKNMINAFFFDLQQVSSGAARPSAPPSPDVRRVGVLGAGMMGGGIAYQCARSGLEVVLRDVDAEAAERGVAYSRRLVERAIARGRSTAEQGAALLARLTPATEVTALAGCDVVIEAVFEDAALKRRVYAEVEPLLAAGALLATNTSTLPITALAAGLARPADFIGTHFFSPVERMPLLEIVVGERTSEQTAARAYDLARLLGKTPIVVNDGRGFFTSRVIGRFIVEAIGMVAEGVPPPSVEQAALQAGYPTGPLALADEVSLALIQRIRAEYAAADGPALGLEQPGHDLVASMAAAGRTGRAGRAGFYDYAPDGARLRLWPDLASSAGAGGRAVPFPDLQERMLFAEALEALACLEGGVLRSARDGDIGSLLGIGFPPWTGGVIRYVETYPGGTAGFVRRAEALAATYGERFRPSAWLVARAERGEPVAAR